MTEDRRGFLGAIVAALFGIPGVAALLGRRGGARWIDAGPLDALPDGEPRRFSYDVPAGWEKRQKACFLVRKGDTVIALDATCTHAGCTVKLGGAAFVCPCHGGEFTLDGAPAKKPVTTPLARLLTRVADGRVQVRV